jgi:hypothetical protein
MRQGSAFAEAPSALMGRLTLMQESRIHVLTERNMVKFRWAPFVESLIDTLVCGREIEAKPPRGKRPHQGLGKTKL